MTKKTYYLSFASLYLCISKVSRIFQKGKITRDFPSYQILIAQDYWITFSQGQVLFYTLVLNLPYGIGFPKLSTGPTPPAFTDPYLLLLV